MAQLYQLFEGQQARDEGMARVDRTVNQQWARDMTMCLREVCDEKLNFTADDVFDLARAKGLKSDTHDRRAFGPIMMRAAKDRWCVKERCPPRMSNRRSLHASPLTVWRSLRFV